MKKYLVYKITNNVNDKIYIGVHKTEDIDDDYIGSGKILKRAINKYGLQHFTKEILYECESEEEMFQREADIVDEEFVRRKDTYNIKIGGYGGWSYVHNNKLSGSEYGNIILKELMQDKSFYRKFCNRISKGLIKYHKEHDNPFKNNKHTDESKAKIGKANSIYQSGKGNSQYGTCWIYSEIEKISKKVKKEELEQWLEKGWLKGRKIKW